MTTAGSPQLTETAKIYGVSQSEPWKTQGKSGLTPLQPPNPNIPQSATQNAETERLRQHQRHLLNGFETRELESAGCMTKENIKAADLTGAIHPLYERERWVGWRSVLDPTDVVVWEALRPILVLASRIIYSAHVWPWFDALLKGQRKRRPRPEYRPDRGDLTDAHALYSFWRRKSSDAFKDSLKQRREFENLAKIFTLEINMEANRNSYAYCNWEYNEVQNPDPKGLSDFELRCCMFVRPELVSRLMRRDISASERVMLEGMLAFVLVHETCHALFKYMLFTRGGLVERRAMAAGTYGVFEYFFEDEAITELGHSCINAILGGVPKPTHNLPPQPTIIICLNPWPNFEYFGTGIVDPPNRQRYRFHAQFHESQKPISIYWPIQIRWFEAIQREEYWTAHVLKNASLRPEQIIGRKFVKLEASGARMLVDPENLSAGRDYEDWLRDPECPGIPPILNYTANLSSSGKRSTKSAYYAALGSKPEGVAAAVQKANEAPAASRTYASLFTP